MVPASLKCDRYDKTIGKNQNKIICEACFGQQHPKCTELNAKYAGTAWTCPKCLISVLPFASTQYLDDTIEELNDEVRISSTFRSLRI